jgi:hypothetical protein
LRPDFNWAGLMAAAPFILIGAKYLLYRSLARSMQRSIGELRAERTRLERLIAEIKQLLDRR